jgi:hypothetical protein
MLRFGFVHFTGVLIMKNAGALRSSRRSFYRKSATVSGCGRWGIARRCIGRHMGVVAEHPRADFGGYVGMTRHLDHQNTDMSFCVACPARQ